MPNTGEEGDVNTGLLNVKPGKQGGRRTRRRRLIGPLKQGLLKKVGYSVTARTSRRHAAVKRAVKKYGKTSTIRKLNAVAVYTRRTSPAKSRTFRSDMKFAKKMKGGVGTAQQLQSLLDKIDAEQLRISNNEYYSNTDPALVRAYNGLRKEAEDLEVPDLGARGDSRGINLGNLRNAVESAHQKAMNQPQ